MTMQRLFAAVTGAILGFAMLAGGPAGLIGNGVPVAFAQSSSTDVANLVGLLSANPPNQTKIDQAIAAGIASGGAGFVAALALTASVSGSTGNSALATAAAGALVQASKSSPTIAAAVGAGLQKASNTLTASGYTGAANVLTATIATASAEVKAAAANVAVVAAVIVISPAQTCTGSCN